MILIRYLWYLKENLKSRINELNIKMINLQIKILIKLYQKFKKK